jgi:hypothetical protein
MHSKKVLGGKGECTICIICNINENRNEKKRMQKVMG